MQSYNKIQTEGTKRPVLSGTAATFPAEEARRGRNGREGRARPRAGGNTVPDRLGTGFPAAGTRVPSRRYPSSRQPAGEYDRCTDRESCSHRGHGEDTEKGTAPVRRGREDWREREEEGKREGRESRFLIPAYTFSGRPGFTGCRAGTPVKKAASIKERIDRDCIHRE